MEKLILLYEQGDGCSWSATDTLPFEYSSKIEAELELLRLWEERIKPREQEIYLDTRVDFAGHKIDLLNFTYFKRDKLHKRHSPTFMDNQIFSLNEWFEQNKNG